MESKNRKIAILSMQRVINYGSVLQAYSLKELIQELTKNEVQFIDIDHNEVIPVHGNVTTSQDYSKQDFNIKRAPWLFFRKIKHKILRKKYENNIRAFQQNELCLDQKNNKEYFDLVVIGSDEVFIAVDHICLQLYGKVENARCIITYAAASGVAQYHNISQDVLPQIEDALHNIRYMSVRDKHTKEYIGKMYSQKIYEHVDPVLAGSLRFRKHKEIPLSKYMIVYAYAERISDLQEIKAIQTFARKNNLKIICVGGQQLWCKNFITVDPFEMLDYFYQAEYVVTDTFHGAVFSIINHCKFAVFLRKSNEFKIKGLLQSVGLLDRLVDNPINLEKKFEQVIDYDKVNNILDNERKRTINYLSECISNIENEK